MIKQKITSAIKEVLMDLGFGEEIEVKLGHPQSLGYGDYSSNIAFVASKKLKKSPIELAGEIKTHFPKLDFIEKVEAVPPGFINFWLAEGYLIKGLFKVPKQKEKIGQPKKKIMVEFAHPNTLKEFHIGHLRNIAIGESICRLLQSQGAKIFRANYQGDIGLHVAKAIWGVLQLCHAEFISASRIIDNKILKQVQDDTLNERIKFLAQAYILGSKSYEEDEKARREIQEINKKIYQKDPSILEIWQKTRQWSLEYFDSIYKRVGSYFDRLFFESEVYQKGKEIVENHLKDGVFVRDQGAVIFDPDKVGIDGEKFGLHKRVFITKEGNATYEGKEMGLAFLEFSEFPFDLAVHVVAHEQAGYFKVVFKALELIDEKFKGRQKHLSYGMVELKEGKMSSRMGNIISAEWLLDEAKSRIKKNFKEMDEETAEKVAVGAVKYSLLKFSVASNVSFSFDESISLEGNSGPYLQYTYARTQSILRKAQNANNQQSPASPSEAGRATINNQPESEELVLLRLIHRFAEVGEEASQAFAPNLLCNYLFDLAQKFNLFYQRHKVIGSSQEEFRFLLVSAVSQILKNGLYLLGIEAPRRM